MSDSEKKSKKSKKSQKIYLYEMPKINFKPEYIKKKKNILFIVDGESNLRVKKLNKNNIIAVNFKDIKTDFSLTKNKKIIKKEFKKVFVQCKKLKLREIALPKNKIGVGFEIEAPLSFKYLTKLIKKLTEDFKDPKESKNDSIKGKKLVEGKKFTKKEKEINKKSKDSIEEKLKESDKHCGRCKKSVKLLKRPLVSDKGEDSEKYIKELKEGLKECKECKEICGKIKKTSKNVYNNIDLIKARYPVICKKDYTKKSKVERIYKKLRDKLKEQYETLNK